ncbi:MAG TPA: efflux RND transporter periplasmic adaptor subunit [Terriglobales bacterium]
MTSRDKKLLLIGMLAGLLVAGFVMTVFFIRQESARAAMQSHGQIPSDSAAQKNEVAPVGTEPGTTVQLNADEINAAGVQLARVMTARITTTVESVGRVEQPEAQLATVPARVSGRIDKLYVQFTGETIRAGQAVAEIYSPDLVASAEEYRLALQNRERMRASSEKEALENANDLVAASRRRLELWGVSDKQIEAAAAGMAGLHVTMYAPSGGSVVERKVTRGQYVNAGDPLFTVADLSTVWVKADVYEFQLPQIRPGQMVDVTSDALPHKMLHGRVDFIEPEANAQTRTIPVHVHVPNPGMRLRPGMYIRATFISPGAREGMVVPRSAVLDTGTRKLVYVAKGDGVFEAREIQTGEPSEERYPVLAGLKAGEEVVTNGNFLIDSQTRLTGGMTGLFAGSKEYNNQNAPASSSGQNSDKPRGKITFAVEPNPPKSIGENMFHVSVVDASGKEVPDADVTVTLIMPAMPAMGMPEMRNTFKLPYAQGMYMGKGNIATAGSWNVVVEAKRNGQVVATYRTQLKAE